MEDVVAQLNASGHNLVVEPADESSAICSETAEDAPGLYFYLCHDSTVSAGWRAPDTPDGARSTQR
jgi:hypothetical protein